MTWRGTADGEPVAFTSLGSTYRHEADSAIGFQMFNDPALMKSPASTTTPSPPRRPGTCG